MVLPNYGVTLKECNYMFKKKEIKILIKDLINQICFFHSMSVVHHDIKPSNIVHKNKCEWRIIDFGLSLTHKPKYIGNTIPVYRGTKNINIPKYNLSNIESESELCFWLYMKDWYGFSNTLSFIDDQNINSIKYFIDNLDKNNLLFIIKSLLIMYKIQSNVFYLKF